MTKLEDLLKENNKLLKEQNTIMKDYSDCWFSIYLHSLNGDSL